MAVRWAVATGVWSNTAIWNGGTLPGAADDVYTSNFIIDIDQDINVGTIRNGANAGAGVPSAGGYFQYGVGVPGLLANGYIQKSGTVAVTDINGTGTITTYTGPTWVTQGNGVYCKYSDPSFATNFSVGDYIRVQGTNVYIGQISSIDTANSAFTLAVAANFNATSYKKFSKTIVGTSTNFLTQLLPNNILKYSGTNYILGEVFSVDSNTQLTLLDTPFTNNTAATLPGTISAFNFTAPVAMNFAGGTLDNGCAIINQPTGSTPAVGTNNSLMYPFSANSQLNIINGKLRPGTSNTAHALDMARGTTAGTANNTIYVKSGVVNNTTGSAAGIRCGSASSQPGNLFIDGDFTGGGGGGGAIDTQLAGVNIKAQYSATITLNGGSGGGCISINNGNSIDLSNANSVTVNAATVAGIFVTNSPTSITLANVTLNPSSTAPAISGASANPTACALWIKSGTINNTVNYQAIYGFRYIKLGESVQLTFDGQALPFKTYGTTNTITPADVWSYATRQLTAAQTFSTSGSVGSVSGSVGSVAGNVAGNVNGSVGSVATDGINNNSLATSAVDEIKNGIDVPNAVAQVVGNIVANLT